MSVRKRMRERALIALGFRAAPQTDVNPLQSYVDALREDNCRLQGMLDSLTNRKSNVDIEGAR